MEEVTSWKNKLFFGDNLHIMREYIPDEYVDLIYLDPPFNSKATYNMLFKEKNETDSIAQIKAFEDTWRWDMAAEGAYDEIVTGGRGPQSLSDLIKALRGFLGQNDMMAYLVMMAIRLVELHRILKPTGSIYLHCDPTASHYIKLVMDAVFGKKEFRNEIIWCYTAPSSTRTDFLRKHDVVLRYSKSQNWTFNWEDVCIPYSEETIARTFRGSGLRGLYLDKNPEEKHRSRLKPKGKIPEDWWTIPRLQGNARERLGYPTQKPEALVERIIKASSSEGDIVMDPFCGCGTTIAVAEKLKRRWVGIDITHLAVGLMKNRLAETFGGELSVYEVIGEPKDLGSAEALAKQDRYEFERWALSLVEARAFQDKKGADTGIDGIREFNILDENQKKKTERIIVQVKSGHVTSSQIRDLKGVIEREEAAIGAFITFKNPTRDMVGEAAQAGFYKPNPVDYPDEKHPKLQILTIEELLNGKELSLPRWGSETTFKKAQRKGKQREDKRLF